MNPRDAAVLLKDRAIESRVRFPKVWDESKLMQSCGANLMLYKVGESFDIDGALASLIEKYGIEDPPAAAEDRSKKTKKRKKVDDDEGEEGEEKPKKERKKATIVNEENRPVAEAIQEMAVIYFKNKEARTGVHCRCVFQSSEGNTGKRNLHFKQKRSTSIERSWKGHCSLH